MLPTILAGAAEFRDIHSVPPDLAVPPLEETPPAAGKRVKIGLHLLYLPTDWTPGKKTPVLIELPGNSWKSPSGDVSTGYPEGSNLGYGLSGGKGYIWVCVPFLNGAGDRVAPQWWGKPPEYDPLPTLKYLRKTVSNVCAEFNGDESNIILCGFSRGAIACNFMGLYDDETSKLWKGFFAYSHYDGVREWAYPGSDRASAAERLKRLGGRPQFICGEATNSAVTEKYLREAQEGGDFTFAGTGFLNHNDAWILRPSPARDQARAWLKKVTAPH
jgi:hypothetical protein